MANAQLDKWKAQIGQLRERMKEASADMRMEIQQQIDNLQRRIDGYT